MRVTSLVLALLLGVAADAHAGDLERLTQEFQVVARRQDDRGTEKQTEILTAIADLRTPKARKALEKLRDRWAEGSWSRAETILPALVRHAGPKDIDAAIRWAEKKRDPLLIEALGDALGSTQSPTARHHLRGNALKRATPPVRAQIARALGLLRDTEAVPTLLLLAKEKDPRVRIEGLYAVGVIGDKRATAPLTVFLQDADARIRDVAAQSLGLLGDPAGAKALCKALDDVSPRVVESAALGLALLKKPECIEHLIDRLEALYPADLRTSDALATALETISGKDLGHDACAWRMWWDTVKAKPFERQECPATGRTVPGIPYYGFRIRSSKVVFVIDVSRSMGWNERLKRAKRELVRVVESFPETTSFNIIVYSDGISAWKKELQAATKSKIQAAVKFVNRLKPQNGTNTYDALQLALHDDEADTIFFLSDGSPSKGRVIEPKRILAEIRMQNRYRRVRIHTVALVIGQPPSAYAAREDDVKAIEFMTHLAKQNDGLSEVVR